jgi:hypothetical protein
MNREDQAMTEDEQPKTDAQKESLRFERCDRTHALDNPDQERVAQFLSAPDCSQDFASVTDLAQHLNISRVTVYRWAKDPRVLRRVEHLSLQDKVVADLFVRREWLPIMRKAVERAKSGDVQAMKFCAACAWPEDSGVGQGLSLSEAIAMTENTATPPSWQLESEARQEKQAQKLDLPSKDENPSESIDREQRNPETH